MRKVTVKLSVYVEYSTESKKNDFTAIQADFIEAVQDIFPFADNVLVDEPEIV